MFVCRLVFFNFCASFYNLMNFIFFENEKKKKKKKKNCGFLGIFWPFFEMKITKLTTFRPRHFLVCHCNSTFVKMLQPT